MFIVTTTMVLVFKKEAESTNSEMAKSGDIKMKDEADDLSLKDTYKILWEIVRLKPVLTLIAIHMTAKFTFAAADGITGLKLIEFGVPKDKLAFLAVPLVPLQIILPILIGKYTAGPNPLNVYLKAYPCRIIMGLFFALMVYWTPYFQQADGHFPFSYYLILVGSYCLHQITVYSIFVAIMAFHAQISDPVVGGTYMTLLNTVSNLGSNWPVTFVLSIVDRLTWTECRGGGGSGTVTGSCASPTEISVCQVAGGQCQTTLDGYYILSVLCAAVGFIWIKFARHKIDRLQKLDKSYWSLRRSR